MGKQRDKKKGPAKKPPESARVAARERRQTAGHRMATEGRPRTVRT